MQSDPLKIRPIFRFAQLLSHIAFVSYSRGRHFGLKNVPTSGGVLLASNHQSFLDPISTTCGLPREGNYMARDTLFKNPWFGRLIRLVNAFPVKQGEGDIGAVKEILRRLKDGKLVLVFPEGTRTRDGSIGKINANSMSIAKKAKASIVPTVIDGAFEAWPRSQCLPRPGNTHVTYAKAITPEEVAQWPATEIARVVAERMAEAMAQSKLRRQKTRAFPKMERPCTC